MLQRAAAGFSQDTETVRVIYSKQGPASCTNRYNVRQRGDIAAHTEHAFRCHQGTAFRTQVFQIRHVIMRIAAQACPGQQCAVNQRSMVFPVHYNDIFPARGKGGNHGKIGQVAT